MFSLARAPFLSGKIPVSAWRKRGSLCCLSLFLSMIAQVKCGMATSRGAFLFRGSGMRFLSRTCTTCQPANSTIMLSRPAANALTPSLSSRALMTKRRMIHVSGVNGDEEVTTPQSKSHPITSKSTSSPTAPTLPPIPFNAHRFVLMRHGESEFNNANIFTGWCDVALTQRGVVESVEAGQVFLSHALNFRKCYTSALTRSIVTAHRCLEAAGVAYTPVVYDWRLNEVGQWILLAVTDVFVDVRLLRS